MKPAHITATTLLATAAIAPAQFYGDPPDDHHPWAIHDANRPQPPRVEPADKPGNPPSDAIVLFDGTEATLGNWISEKQPDGPLTWKLVDGSLECQKGSGTIRSKAEFGDCQLHIEWAAPAEVKGNSQGRGNSGVFLPGGMEVQVLDNYDNPTYPDGFAGSVYGVMPPMANPLNGPGKWQSYDIVFRRPIWKDGKEIDPGYVTVFSNGVLVQDHTPLEGGGGHRGRSKPRAFPETGPLKMQDHGNPTRFRNIWYRPLPPRATQSGTNGYLTKEATMAKRAEIAAGVREDAAKLEGKAKMLKLWESITYQENADALSEATTIADQIIADIKSVPADKIESRKGEVNQLNNATNYLIKHKRIPADYPPAAALKGIIKSNGWDKK